MPETKMWTNAHRRGILGNCKSFIRELDTLRDPKKIFESAQDKKSQLCTLYKKLIVSLKKEFYEDIKRSTYIQIEWSSERKRTPKDFYHYILGCFQGYNFNYREKPIEFFEKADLAEAIAGYFDEEYVYDSYSDSAVGVYVDTVKNLCKVLTRLSKGTEFYDKKEKTLYLYRKEVPLEVRNKLIEKYGERWYSYA